MKRGRIVVLLIAVAAILLAGCISSNGTDSSKTAQQEKPAAAAAANADSTAQPDAPAVVEEEMDEITRAYTEKRYLDVIRLYEAALIDPSASITEKMKEQYSASFDKYVEAALEKAQNVLGQEKDYDAAVIVLQSFLSQADGIEKVTTPLEKAKNEYITSKHADIIDKAYQAGDYLLAIQRYEEARDKGIVISEEMTLQYATCFSKYVEATCAQAEAALGPDKDYTAAIQLLQTAIDRADQYDSITVPLQDEAVRYAALYYENAMDEAFIAGDYLKAIQVYRGADDEGLQATEQMKQQYAVCFDKYVEAVCAQADAAFGENKDLDAASAILRRAIDDAWQYTAITEPLMNQASRYVTLYHEDVMNKAFIEGDFLKVAREYEADVADGIEVTEQMERQYAACFDEYLKKLDAEAKSVLGTDMEYDAAIQTLSRHMEEAEPFERAYGGLEDLIYDYIVDKYAYLVDKAYQAGNYLEAAQIYVEAMDREVTNPSDTMQQQYEDSVAQYVKSVSDEAQAAFGSSKDYNAAMTRVHSALAEANDVDDIATQLEAIVAEYETFIPVTLTSLKYTQKTRVLQICDRHTDDDILKDVNGNIHNRESSFYLDHYDRADTEDESYIMYNLNYQYSTLTGIVYRPYSSLSCETPWNYPGFVKIYGDGQLLYQSPDITKDTYDSYSVSIDVSGVRNLKIVVYGQWTEPFELMRGFNVYDSKVCLGDLMLQK